MPNKFRINALILFALAILFYVFFMTSKHDGFLSVVNAFAEDPYDAVGSFGAQIVILALYPTSVTQSTLGALFTVIVAALLLFAPMWAMGFFLILDESTEGGAIPHLAGLAFVAFIYISLETS